MSNETYVNHYVEILTSTITDAVMRNISLQANAKISEGVIIEHQNKIEEQKQYITNLENQLNELNNMKGVYENIKHQVGHIDTFKNELIKERDLHQQTRNDYELTIKELNEKIEYLQLTPAKRKKIDEIKVPAVVETLEVNEIDNSIIKDGGSF